MRLKNRSHFCTLCWSDGWKKFIWSRLLAPWVLVYHSLTKKQNSSLLSSHPQVAKLQRSWYKEGLYFFRYAEYPCTLNLLWSTFEELVLAWFVPGLTLATCAHCTLGFPQKLLSSRAELSGTWSNSGSPEGTVVSKQFPQFNTCSRYNSGS